MSSKLLFKLAARYPGWGLLTIILGLWGGVFNGVGTALIAPIILYFGDRVRFTRWTADYEGDYVSL